MALALHAAFFGHVCLIAFVFSAPEAAPNQTRSAVSGPVQLCTVGSPPRGTSCQPSCLAEECTLWEFCRQRTWLQIKKAVSQAMFIQHIHESTIVNI